MAMRRRIMSYTVSGGKDRMVLKYHWWTNRVMTDGFATFSSTTDLNTALRLFKRLKVKYRQIDLRFHNRRTKPRAWLWEKMTVTNNRINR
jgi:hypothetical protein